MPTNQNMDARRSGDGVARARRAVPAASCGLAAWIRGLVFVGASMGLEAVGGPIEAPASTRIDSPQPDSGVDASDGGGQPVPILFEGLGLEGFVGRSSIARALDRSEPDREVPSPLNLDMSVVGPGLRGNSKPLKLLAEVAPPGPLQAVVKSRVSGLDVSAGVDASAETILTGPARWVGGIGIQESGPMGKSELAVRTSLRYADEERLIRVEVGPRFERSLGGGVTLFLDGKAEAETAASLVEPVATLPGMMGSQALGFVGVTGRTGILR